VVSGAPVVPNGDPVVPNGDPVVPVVNGDPVVLNGDPVVLNGDPVVPVVNGDPVVDGPPVVGTAVVVVLAGDAAACAGTTTECTIGRVHDFGRMPARMVLAPMALSIGLRSGSSAISLNFLLIAAGNVAKATREDKRRCALCLRGRS
jgi:uncharacterized Zn-binding protein involved in type VI secretion